MEKGKVSFWWYVIYFIIVFIIIGALWVGIDYGAHKSLTVRSLSFDLLQASALAFVLTVGFYLQVEISKKQNQKK